MATAAIAAGTSLLSGLLGKGGAKSAAKAQVAAFNNGLAQQQRQYDTTRSDMMPFMSAGTGALDAQQTLLGLHGNDPQAAAIAALKASPGFMSLFDTGQDTILQNAAATGGLRGGNTNNSLAQFGSGLLAQVIQNQLQNLGGISSMGSGTAGQLGSLGQANANAQSGIYGQIGGAQANGILGSTMAMQSMINGIGGAAGNYFGGMTGGSAPASAPRGW